MAEQFDTGKDLLIEAARVLEAAASACDSAEDAAEFIALGDRIHLYLASTRSTTTLGMPLIVNTGQRLSDEMVIRRSDGKGHSHVRIVPN
jgi:hypothetical protein